MNVHIPKKQLADSLGHVERIIPSKSSNPGLSLLRVGLAESALILSGSNMEIDIEARVLADVTGEGNFALPAHMFSQIIRSLPGEAVSLAFGGSEVDISSDSYDTRLRLEDVAAIPAVTFPDSYHGEIEAEKLVRVLSSVRYAAAVAEYQAIFRGVKLELNDSRIRAVSTDGFRLAYYHLDESSGLDGEVVAPAKSVDELVRLLVEDPVRLELAEGQLSLQSGPYRTNVKLMEGTFPDYERVIPGTFPLSVTVNAEVLSEAVSRVALVSDKAANNRVDLFIKGGRLQITAEGGYGRSQEALEVSQEGTDPEIALAYNAKYLVDALAPVAGNLRISFSGATTPSVMADLGDPSYFAMVVPLRTG